MLLFDRAFLCGHVLAASNVRRNLKRILVGLLALGLPALGLASSAALAEQSTHRASANSSSCSGRWPCDLGGPFVLTDYLRPHRSENREVIAGTCYSRCTISLISGACVMPNAVLGFHAVTNMFGNIDRVATETVESLYPLGIRRWIRQTGAMDSLQIKTLSGVQAIQLGIPVCSQHAISSKLR